jgi:hypothetical protein
MREQRLLTGGKRWHGTDFLDLEFETLTPLQKFFEPYGNVVLSGCKITLGGGGIYTLNEGYVGCLHADGYKIAKLSTTVLGTTPTYPMYLKIDKTTENKLYDDGLTKQSVDVYAASMTTSIPGAGLYLTILNSSTSGQPAQWKGVLLAKNAWKYAHTGIGTFVFLNGFGDGFAVTSPADNLRVRADISGNAWLAGSIDYTPLGAGPFGGYGLQVTRLEVGTRPDREIVKDLTIALPGGTATIRHTLRTDGYLYARAIAFGGGVSDIDIPSGSPFGEYLEMYYPVA